MLRGQEPPNGIHGLSLMNAMGVSSVKKPTVDQAGNSRELVCAARRNEWHAGCDVTKHRAMSGRLSHNEARDENRCNGGAFEEAVSKL